MVAFIGLFLHLDPNLYQVSPFVHSLPNKCKVSGRTFVLGSPARLVQQLPACVAVFCLHLHGRVIVEFSSVFIHYWLLTSMVPLLISLH